MTSPCKAWKNPSDIMKTRHLKQHSSFSLSKTKSSIGISRRHSFTILTQNCENSQSSQLGHTQLNTSSHSLTAGSQKRKNPFGCDLSNQSKRRSVLNIGAEQTESPALYRSVSVIPNCFNELTASGMEMNSAVDSKENRLLSALTLREEKVDISASPTHDSDFSTLSDKSEMVRDVLKEKPVMTNVEVADFSTLSDKSEMFHDVLKEKPVMTNVEVAASDTSSHQTKVHTSPPLDWSLKSKARVIVHSSVGQFKKYPGIDAKNVDSYIHHTLDNSQDWKDLDILQQIRRCCMHYSYPHLPWLSTFPRMSHDYKSRLPNVITSSKEVLDSLQKDWCSTLTAVYQQLRGGLCPYFYVCAHQFSVLFRCLRSHDQASWSALLSPTTRGLREMLIKEGIEFRMPNIRCTKVDNLQKCKGSDLQDSTKTDSLPLSQSDQIASEATSTDDSLQKETTARDDMDKSARNRDDSSEDEADIAGDDDASRWLEGMGLDKRDFPSLEPFKVKLQREGYREIDHRPQSLVLVEGVDVHSFFNFLLNYPACIASSGAQHGIPPTILSPVSFVGGKLVQNMVKHTTLNDGPSNSSGQVGNPKGQSTHVFEISGPLLPHHVLNMASIMHSSDSLSSTISFSTHNPSSAFNVKIECNSEKDKQASGLSKLLVNISQANHGLLQDVKDQLLASPFLDPGIAVREMHISKSGYSMSF